MNTPFHVWNYRLQFYGTLHARSAERALKQAKEFGVLAPVVAPVHPKCYPREEFAWVFDTAGYYE